MHQNTRGKASIGGSCWLWTFLLSWLIAATYVIRKNVLKASIVEFVHSDGYNTQTEVLKNDHVKQALTGQSSFRQAPVDQYFHIVFSTDCSFFQDWQTLLVFYSASVVKQEGLITRIASGCSKDKEKELIDLYKKLFPQYRVHFTPDFKTDSKTGKKYDFYNKPYGIRDWLQNTKPIPNKEEIIVLIDPDMIFLRPLVFRVRDNPANIYMPGIDPHSREVPERYGRGHPVAQLYGLGAPWTNDRGRGFNRTHICGAGSPCLKTERQFGEDHFR
jgi:hypothetical protein